MILLTVAALAASAKHPATQIGTKRPGLAGGGKHQAATAQGTDADAPVARATSPSTGRTFYLDRRGSDANSG
ncbi:MAG: hypothetical protein ACRDXB_09305, partial [Actinomycetes bacterium]